MIVLSTETREIEIFICCKCGFEDKHDKPKCAYCGLMNTYTSAIATVREKRSLRPAKVSSVSSDRNRAIKITEIEATPLPKFSSGFPSFDRVLSGGMTLGSVIILGGDPGAGKSTIAMQILGSLTGDTTLYGVVERTKEETTLEGRRLSAMAPFLHVLGGGSFEELLENARDIQPSAMVVDSLHMFHADACPGRTGGVAQTVYMTKELCSYAHEEHCTIILICHVNKEGEFEGRNTIKHLVDVDAMLQRGRFNAEDNALFEQDPQGSIIRISSTKNRFGSTINIGFLSMTDVGLRERA